MLSRLFSVLAYALLFGCAANDDHVFVEEHPSELQIELRPSRTVFHSSTAALLEGTIKNTGPDRILFYDHDLTMNHALAVFDARGTRMTTIPPPMPITRRELHRYCRSLASGEGYDSSYSLNMFSPPLPDGSYKVTIERVPTNSVEMIIDSSLGTRK